MATYVLVAVIGASLIFAARRIYQNFAEGAHDCCGESGGCAKCARCGK